MLRATQQSRFCLSHIKQNILLWNSALSEAITFHPLLLLLFFSTDNKKWIIFHTHSWWQYSAKYLKLNNNTQRELSISILMHLNVWRWKFATFCNYLSVATICLQLFKLLLLIHLFIHSIIYVFIISFPFALVPCFIFKKKIIFLLYFPQHVLCYYIL